MVSGAVRAFGSGRRPGQVTHGGYVGSGTVRAFGSGRDLGSGVGLSALEPLEHSGPGGGLRHSTQTS